MANQAYKISQKQKQMYVAVNAMRAYMKSEALKHTQKAFRDEGFTNNTLIKWKPLKRSRKSPFTGRKILDKTSALKNSITAKSSSTKNDFYVNLSSSKPYADIHNEGLRGRAFGKYPFKMPKRQFMGYSKVLDKKLEKFFRRRISIIFKN